MLLPEAIMSPSFYKHLKAVEATMVEASFNETVSERGRHDDFETSTLPG